MCPANRLEVAVIGLCPAVTTGAMTRRKRHGFVKKEDGGPSSRAGKRVSPTTEFGDTRDPQVTAVLAHYLSRLVDETTSVAREHPAGGFGMQVAPGVDTVAERHLPIVVELNRGADSWLGNL
jgi:hypothetical protein